jgi:hypothetical protein
MDDNPTQTGIERLSRSALWSNLLSGRGIEVRHEGMDVQSEARMAELRQDYERLVQGELASFQAWLVVISSGSTWAAADERWKPPAPITRVAAEVSATSDRVRSDEDHACWELSALQVFRASSIDLDVAEVRTWAELVCRELNMPPSLLGRVGLDR